MSSDTEIKESESWFPNLTPARLHYREVANLPITFENILKGLDALNAYREQQIVCLDMVEMKQGELNLILQRDLENLQKEKAILESIGRPDGSGIIRDKAKSFAEANIIHEKVTSDDTTRYLRAQVNAMTRFLPVIAGYADRMEAFTMRRIATWRAELPTTSNTITRVNQYKCKTCGLLQIPPQPWIDADERVCSYCHGRGFTKI